MSENRKWKLFLLIVLLGMAAYMGWHFKGKGIQIDPIGQAKVMYAECIGISEIEKNDIQKQMGSAVQSECAEETEIESEKEQESEKEVEKQPKLYQVINIRSHLTVRSGPSKDTEKVGSLDNGTICQMEELSEDGKWMKIITEDGANGWVSREYLAEIS